MFGRHLTCLLISVLLMASRNRRPLRGSKRGVFFLGFANRESLNLSDNCVRIDGRCFAINDSDNRSEN